MTLALSQRQRLDSRRRWRAGAAGAALALLGAVVAGRALHDKLERSRPPARPPRVLLLVPHLGGDELVERLRCGDLAAGGLRQMALRSGTVHRRVECPGPATTTAMMAALLSGRLPAATGATMREVPSPHHRHTRTLPGLGHKLLGYSFLRDRPQAATLAVGLSRDLLPLDAATWEACTHGTPHEVVVPLAHLEDPATAGWLGVHAREDHRDPAPRAASVLLPHGGAVDLLVGGTPAAVRAVCRGRDPQGASLARAWPAPAVGLPERAHAGWIVDAPVRCLASPVYEVPGRSLLTTRRGEGAGGAAVGLIASPPAHLLWDPPQLAVELPSAPVCSRPDGGGRWRDAEALAVLVQALDLGRHDRMVALLDGPGGDPGVTLDDIDLLLGWFARRVLERGGELIVVGLAGGQACRQVLSLAALLGSQAQEPPRSGVVVHAEESYARIDVAESTAAKLRALQELICALLGDGAEIAVETRGVLHVTAAAGQALDGRDGSWVAGRDGSEPAMHGSAFLLGRDVPRQQHLRTDIRELHRQVAARWRGY